MKSDESGESFENVPFGKMLIYCIDTSSIDYRLSDLGDFHARFFCNYIEVG